MSVSWLNQQYQGSVYRWYSRHEITYVSLSCSMHVKMHWWKQHIICLMRAEITSSHAKDCTCQAGLSGHYWQEKKWKGVGGRSAARMRMFAFCSSGRKSCFPPSQPGNYHVLGNNKRIGHIEQRYRYFLHTRARAQTHTHLGYLCLCLLVSVFVRSLDCKSSVRKKNRQHSQKQWIISCFLATSHILWNTCNHRTKYNAKFRLARRKPYDNTVRDSRHNIYGHVITADETHTHTLEGKRINGLH